MRIFVDPWEPGYGTAMDLAEDGPAQRSTAALDTDLELPADDWRPLLPGPGTAAPDIVHVVDGVRRIDARLWLETDDQTYAGIAASYAAGVVCCDLRAGVADLVRAKIERGLFSASPDIEPIGVPPARYEAFPLDDQGPNVLVNAVQARMTGIENDVSASLDDGALVVRDGPLRTRSSGANVIGYVKTHSRQYLDDRLTAVVTGLHPGQRSPIFTIESQRPIHSWYLRLPGPVGSAWAGIVRVECSGDLSTDAAVALADVSAVALPRFASTSYKDARAPQNLIPIAGLERRLRALLGDSRLLHRTLSRNASRAAGQSAGLSAVAST
jgi:hypothetical protein